MSYSFLHTKLLNKSSFIIQLIMRYKIHPALLKKKNAISPNPSLFFIPTSIYSDVPAVAIRHPIFPITQRAAPISPGAVLSARVHPFFAAARVVFVEEPSALCAELDLLTLCPAVIIGFVYGVPGKQRDRVTLWCRGTGGPVLLLQHIFFSLWGVVFFRDGCWYSVARYWRK